MPRSLIDAVLGALIVAGIGGMVVLYGDGRGYAKDLASLRRDIDKVELQSHVHGEAIARAEERIKLGCPK